MDIAANLMISPSISYAKDEILSALKKDVIPDKIYWYGVTTSFEENSLMYILSGLEYRHPMYHRKGKKLKLLCLAGSRQEAMEQVRCLVQQHVDSHTLMEMKASLEAY